MDGTFSPLSQEKISHKLARIDEALLKLDGANASYAAPEISKDDLFDIFMEARERLVTQLAALAESGDDLTHVSLEYTYQIEAIRHRMGLSS